MLVNENMVYNMFNLRRREVMTKSMIEQGDIDLNEFVHLIKNKYLLTYDCYPLNWVRISSSELVPYVHYN